MNIALPHRPDTHAETRLAQLAAQARSDLAMLDYATRPWVLPRQWNGQTIPDVVIIGAGQSGLVLGHTLKRRGVGNILLLDRNPEGYEGVWETYARNYEIRSPKTITGADLGIPSLSIQSWFVARHGQEAWDAIDRVPRVDWMNYLRWYRDIADLPIRNGVNVVDVDYDADGVTLSLDTGETVRTRYVVFATGMEGGGDWIVPDPIRNALPDHMYNHSCEVYDSDRLRGKDVGILGAGASAFDSSVAALESGARRVDTFMRRAQIGLLDLVREFETGGYLNHSHELSDETKWELGTFLTGLSQAPAEHHFNKALSFSNFKFWNGAPWDKVAYDDGKAVVTTPRGVFKLDHVIAATGVTVDLSIRPELRRLAGDALLWRDRFTPPDGDMSAGRLKLPYLDRDYRLQQREPGAAPGIERLFIFNALATLSMGGLSAVSISGHRFGVPRIASGLTRALFLDQEDQLIPTLREFDTPSIQLTPYARAMLGMNETDD